MSDLVGIDTQLVDSSRKYDINRVYRIKHQTYGGGAWLYGKASENIGAGDFVHYASATGFATLMDTTESADEPGRIAAADVAITSGSWGWFWHGEGTFEAVVVDAVTAATQLTTTATAGEAGTGGDTISSLQNVDLGVDQTRVTVEATGLMFCGA